MGYCSLDVFLERIVFAFYSPFVLQLFQIHLDTSRLQIQNKHTNLQVLNLYLILYYQDRRNF